jgi:hypothetical protein
LVGGERKTRSLFVEVSVSVVVALWTEPRLQNANTMQLLQSQRDAFLSYKIPNETSLRRQRNGKLLGSVPILTTDSYHTSQPMPLDSPRRFPGSARHNRHRNSFSFLLQKKCILKLFQPSRLFEVFTSAFLFSPNIKEKIKNLVCDLIGPKGVYGVSA